MGLPQIKKAAAESPLSAQARRPIMTQDVAAVRQC